MSKHTLSRAVRTLVLFSVYLPLCTACLSERLTAHLDYLSSQSLASYHVQTPDPNLNTPPTGQRILISWDLPTSYFTNYPSLCLKLRIRFCNHQETVLSLKLSQKQGMYFYFLINEDYFATGGVQAYKVEVCNGGQILERWQHQLWTELITLDSPHP